MNYIKWVAVLACCVGLFGCAKIPAVDAPYRAGFFYLTLGANPVLALMDSPSAAPRKQIALNPPTDCSLYALHPAPVGRWIAVEWECAFGPALEMFDSASGESHFVLSDPTIDSRLMAWLPDGRSLFVRIGTLSVPQTLRVDAATGIATELVLSPFAYELTSSADGRKTLFSLSKGTGFGSETWLAGPDGQNPSQLMVDANNIIRLAHYSPDGSQIAFIKVPDNQPAGAPGELWVMDAAGFNGRKLALADTGMEISPVWSPDGRKIAFAGRTDLAQAPVNVSIYDLEKDILRSYPAASKTPLSWSPDGTLVAFSIASDAANVDGTISKVGGNVREVWFYDAASGQAKKVADGACCAGWIR